MLSESTTMDIIQRPAHHVATDLRCEGPTSHAHDGFQLDLFLELAIATFFDVQEAVDRMIRPGR